MKCINTVDAVGHVLCHDITRIVKDVTKDTAFRKGHIVTEEDIPVLLSLGKDHLYVWEKDESMLHENEAAQILCEICENANMHPTEVKEGKIELIADCDGLFRVDVARLDAINEIDEIMIATTADHPVMAFAKPCESEPEQMWIDLKDTAPFEYILGPPSTVLGRTGRRSLREAGVEPLGLDTYLSASFAAAMAREGVGLAFTYRSCRIMRDEFRYLRIGKDGIFLDLALAWPAGKYRSRAAMALAKLFQEMAPELLRR